MCGAGPCDTSGVIRTMQVTGLLTSRPSVPSCEVHDREVHERSTAGTSQVSKRSAETGQLGAGSSVAGRCILQAMRGPGRRGLQPRRGSAHEAPRRQAAQFPSPRRYPDTSRVHAAVRGSREPCVGQTVGPPVIIRRPGGLFTEDGGPSPVRLLLADERQADSLAKPAAEDALASRLTADIRRAIQ